jgi:hypothetical protein
MGPAMAAGRRLLAANSQSPYRKKALVLPNPRLLPLWYQLFGKNSNVYLLTIKIPLL